MSNLVYPKGRQGFAGGDVAWDTDVIKAVLCDVGYVYNAAHQYLSGVDAGARVATSAAFTTKTLVDGVLDADDLLLAALPTGDTITSVIVYQDTGVEATSRLLVFFDTKADTTPINLETDGGDVIVTWSNTATRIAVV